MKNKFESNVLKSRSVLATQIPWICAIALVAVIGFSMAACDDESGDGGTWGNPPSELVGTWLTMGVSPVLVINADGTGSNAGDPVTSWKVKGSELKMTYSGVESVVKWSISGNQLTLSYPDDTSLLGVGSLLIAYSPLTKQSGNNPGGGGPGSGLSALVGDWQKNGVTIFQVTAAGKFIMSDTTYDISVSGNTATLKFGGTTVGTFDFAINNNQMVIFNGTGVGTTVAALSPVGKSSGSGGGGNQPQSNDPGTEVPDDPAIPNVKDEGESGDPGKPNEPDGESGGSGGSGDPGKPNEPGGNGSNDPGEVPDYGESGGSSGSGDPGKPNEPDGNGSGGGDGSGPVEPEKPGTQVPDEPINPKIK